MMFECFLTRNLTDAGQRCLDILPADSWARHISIYQPNSLTYILVSDPYFLVWTSLVTVKVNEDYQRRLLSVCSEFRTEKLLHFCIKSTRKPLSHSPLNYERYITYYNSNF